MRILKMGSIVAVVMMAVSVMSAVAQPQQSGDRQRQGQQQQGTPEEQAKASVERLVEPLKLTKEQQKKLYDVYLEIIEARTSQQGNRQQGGQQGGQQAGQQQGERPDREAMMKAREEQTKKIKAVLTPEQQKLYDELEEQMRERQGNNQQGQRQQRQ